MQKHLIALGACCALPLWLLCQSIDTQLYTYPNNNASPNRMIRTQDGGYLMVANLFCYSPYATPIEGCPTGVWITRVDMAGNTLWSRRHQNFDPGLNNVHIFENADNTFTLLGSTAGLYTCEGIGIGPFITFSRATALRINGANGDILSQDYYADECEFALNSAVRTATGDILALGFYNVPIYINSPPPVPMWLHVGPNGSSIDHEYASVAISAGKLLSYDANTVLLFGRNNTGLFSLSSLTPTGQVLTTQSVITLSNGFAIQEFIKLASGELAVLLVQNNSQPKSYVLRISPSGQLLDQLILPYANTSMTAINNRLLLTSTLTVNNIRDIRITTIDDSWQVQNATVLDLGSTRENPIQILPGAPNEVTILSNYHFFNLLPVFGPAQIALSKFNPEEVLAVNYAADAVVTAPSPSGSSNGSVEVIVSETGNCSGIYNVSITPITTGGVTPAMPLITTYIGYPAGSFLFTGVSAGQYQITIQEAGACGTDPLPLQLIATVTNAVNTSPPVLYLLDFLGQLIADTDPSTPVGDHPNLGLVTITDGNCVYSESFYVYGITADGQLLQAQDFSLQLTPPSGNGSAGLSAASTGIFQLDVGWPQGNTQLKVTGEDAGGNSASLYLQRNSAGGTLPEISINIMPGVLTIPVCANSVTALVTIVIDDPCVPSSTNFNNMAVSFGGATGVINFTGNNYREYLVTFPAAGPYLLSTSYTNSSGQVAFIDKLVVVTQATFNMPPVISTDIDTLAIPPCNGLVDVFSFTICDDCAPINIQNVTFNGGGSGFPNLNGQGFYFTDNIAPNCIYIEVAGTISTTGTYYPLINYQGVELNAPLVVIENPAPLHVQRVIQNQPDVSISQAPLQYSMSVCDTCRSVTEVFRITKCGPVIPSQVYASYGNDTITPSSFNINNNTYVFNFSVCTTDNDLPFVVFYTDVSGEVFTVETSLEVTNNGGDQLAPLIFAPLGPIPLTIYNCASPAANYWLEPQLLEFCPPTPTVQSATPSTPGFQFLQVGEALFLANAQHAGSYEASLQATDASGNIGRDTTVFDVTDAGGGTVPVCVDTVDLAIGAQGWALLSSAQALGGSGTCLSPEDYYVKVLDGNPSNGNQVDGCGEYVYEIYTAQTSPAQGFTGAYAPDHWAVHLHPNASASFSGDLNVNLGAPAAFGAFAITFPTDGQLAFDYTYPSAIELAEYQFRLVDVNGNVVANWEGASSGHIQQTVAIGETLIFYFKNDQNNSGETAMISNWAFDPTTSDDPICSGLVRAYDDLAPVAVTQTPVIQLDDSGLAQMTIDQLDNGSYDNCALASREIRRLYTNDPITCEPVTPYYSDWGSTVDFTCCDACQDIAVELRLRDETGNESTFVTTVEPKEDRIPIIIASDIDPLCCPDPAQCAVTMQYSFIVTDDCTDDPSVFVLFDQNADGVGLLSRSYHRLPNGKYKVNAWTAPIGHHAIVIRTRDACDNYAERIIPFQVADCTDGYPPIIMLGEGDHGREEQFISQRNPPLLEQNTPNPFREETQVRFWLPQAGAAVFSIVDINGRVVFQVKNNYDQGWHALTLQASDLPARGLYFYQLEAAGQLLRRKLVRL